MYEIKAALKAPLMIGGKTLNSSYRESRDYIPGSVLRAAYAKALVQRCGCEQENYRLVYRGQEECGKCGFQTVCRNFGRITFPTLYPMGSAPYPATAREKKYKEEGERSVLDILKCRLKREEKAEGESAWIKLEGLHKDGVPVRLMHSAITRTAIDYRRNVARDGALYTQNAILEKYLDEKKELLEVVFSGETGLSQKEVEELNHIGILYIGADITRGFGICHMSYEEKEDDDTPEKIRERIREFNAGAEGEMRFVALDLLTDAYLGLEEIGREARSRTEISDEDMRVFLEKKIGLPDEKYHLYKVFKSQEIHRGFDTSKTTEKEMRRKGRLVVKGGAVFVYRISSGDIDEEELLRFEKKGIGENTGHGFGRIRICDPFHVKYDVLGET